jgi:hypothetical protein
VQVALLTYVCYSPRGWSWAGATIVDRHPKRRAVGGGLLALLLLPVACLAQVTEPLLPLTAPPSGPQAPVAPGQPTFPGESVAQRPRPEFQPIGLHVGDYFWFPRGEFDETYNSNIFATPSPTHDFITTVQPSFDLLSSFPRNALNMRGNAALQFYADHPAQNTQDGWLDVNGRLDVTGESAFYGDAQAAHRHISYGSPNSPGNVAQPVTYDNYSATLGYAQRGRPFTYQAEIAVQAAEYNPVPLVGGGTLSQSANDTTISQAALRAGYEFIPDYLGYVRVAGDLYDYWHTLPGQARFNSTVYRVDFGLQILPRHIIYGEVYAGYLDQNFAAAGLGSMSGPDIGGRLVWDVTRLTTLAATGLRTFIPSNPTIGVTGAGYLASIFTITADHELLRNLLLNVNASYENDSFQSAARTDNVFTAGTGFRYLVNPNLFLGGDYTYQQRSSSVPGLSFAQNILTLRLGTQF